jgi:hypothetical protein
MVVGAKVSDLQRRRFRPPPKTLHCRPTRDMATFLLQHRIRHTDSEDSEDDSEGACFDACRCAPGGACAVGTCGCMAPNTSVWDGPLYDPVTGTLRPLLIADPPPFTIPVFECNSGCTCGPECCNRVTQRRREGAVSAGVLHRQARRPTPNVTRTVPIHAERVVGRRWDAFVGECCVCIWWVGCALGPRLCGCRVCVLGHGWKRREPQRALAALRLRRVADVCAPGCSLEVFDTGTARGQGCRTLTPIPKGAFVCEYVGVLVSSDAPPNNYTFCVRVRASAWACR